MGPGTRRLSAESVTQGQQETAGRSLTATDELSHERVEVGAVGEERGGKQTEKGGRPRKSMAKMTGFHRNQKLREGKGSPWTGEV